MALRSLAATLLLASSALAKTDLAGCTYTDTVVKPSDEPAYASRIWYVPGTGELCDFLDCGGGMAPPKTNVPGCPLYKGTATYSPSYIDLPTAGGKVATTLATATTTGTAVAIKTSAGTEATASSSGAVSIKTTDTGAVTPTAAPTGSQANTTPAGTGSQGTITQGGAQGNSTATSTSLRASNAINGAAPTAVALMGSCLIAGLAACAGLL